MQQFSFTPINQTTKHSQDFQGDSKSFSIKTIQLFILKNEDSLDAIHI